MGIPKKQAGFLLLDGLGAWVCVLIGGLLALEVFQAGKGLFLARRTLEESSRAAVHLLDTGAPPSPLGKGVPGGYPAGYGGWTAWGGFAESDPAPGRKDPLYLWVL